MSKYFPKNVLKMHKKHAGNAQKMLEICPNKYIEAAIGARGNLEEEMDEEKHSPRRKLTGSFFEGKFEDSAEKINAASQKLKEMMDDESIPANIRIELGKLAVDTTTVAGRFAQLGAPIVLGVKPQKPTWQPAR